MVNNFGSKAMSLIADAIEIPEGAYLSAERRYQDIGDWFGRTNSEILQYDPRIFPQGSFRLGTVVRPINGNESYDLDVVCELKEGITQSTSSQQQLKELVGREVESYRKFRNLKEKEEKHRCWRLQYQTEMKFHIDILPCIPEDESRRSGIKAAMIKSGAQGLLAGSLSELTVAVTDNTHPNYRVVNNGWNICNPEGYARWFESRMKQAKSFLEMRAIAAKEASIDQLPIYHWKTPLQRCVQLLKRHRDNMFRLYPSGKPISIIITTLAAQSYSGEVDIDETMENILTGFEGLVAHNSPRIPNPVNPSEDFAEKWTTSEGFSQALEDNFWQWLEQAKADFTKIRASDSMQFVSEQANLRFATDLKVTSIAGALGVSSPSIIFKPEVHQINNPPKPWSGDR
jgi:hypothetical protein